MIKKRYYFYLLILVLITWRAVQSIGVTVDSAKEFSSKGIVAVDRPIKTEKSLPIDEKSVSKEFTISVPYVNEAPENIWTGPWKNACEEATIVMVEKYYQGVLRVDITEAKRIMLNLFEEQDKLYGTNANSDAERTAHLIEFHSSFKGVVVLNPSIEDIKKEILAGRPIISMNRGFDLKNPNIPFLASGSSYHTTVVVGFDDESREFIVHDPGDSTEGEYYRYGYDLFMNSLHDYNYTTAKADGPPRVIFTSKL